jgi:hypothetical protein
MRRRRPSALLTSHFGPVPDVDDAFDAATDRIHAWSDTVRATLERDAGAEVGEVAAALGALAAAEFERETGRAIDLARYDAIGSIRMNATGLSRYWRKRWERETGA